MIDWLEVKNFAIAERLQLEFESSFTTITGETGSGKSLIVDALGLLLGDRTDNSLIRHGCDKAEIQGGFTLPPNHAAENWLLAAELENEYECILRREIRRDKPSKAYINGKAVPASQLKQLGSLLVDIHGQHEHHSLLQTETQRQILDSYADCTQQVMELSKLFQQWQQLNQQLDQINSEGVAAQEKADLLTFQLQELESLQPTENEWEILDKQQKKLSHLQELITTTQRISQLLNSAEDNTVSINLERSISDLQPLHKFDESLQTVTDMLTEANVNIEEASAILTGISQQNDLNEEEMNVLESRCSLYHSLARKHRIAPELLYEKFNALKTELNSLKNPDIERERLQNELNHQQQIFQKLAKSVTSKRNHAAKIISRSVTDLMQELGMVGGQFQIELKSNDHDNPSKFGNESPEFIVTANKGQPLKPLSRVASGGELSRISLAIQVLVANAAQVSTLIFDEVDVGISGGVAEVVGKKLRELGSERQVLCITHLSQVAAMGNHHLSVSKTDGPDINISVTALDQKQRITEIAKMTGGQALTPESLAHAEQMLKTA